MKFILTIAIILLGLASTPARAESFYVELGRAPSEAEARAMWDELHATHKTLAKYDVYPNQILQADGSFVYRVQAGPMVDKNEAQRVCRRLFRRQVACFVIEGFDPNNAKTFDAAAKAAPVGRWDFLPWNKSESAVVEAAPAPASVPAAAPTPEKKAEAKVDVAEAIAVPVTENNEVTVSEPVQISVDNTPVVSSDNAGWLSVQPFLDEGRAQKFWNNLKRQAPEETRSLSIQVIRPVVSHDIPKVILAVGRFESEVAAVKFCRDYIPSSNYLECQFSSQPPQGEEPGTAKRAAVAEDEYSLFWVQVLSEKTQDRALEKWERIRTDNDDLLADVRSQITTSLSNPGVYVVRIGPLKSKSKAGGLCDALKARKVACTLVGTSINSLHEG